MDAETIQNIAQGTIAGLGIVAVWAGKLQWDTRRVRAMDDHVLTVGEHDKLCTERWEMRSRTCNLELKIAVRDGILEALRAIHEEIAEVKDEQKSQRDRIDRIRDQIKSSYAGATIAGGSLASAIAASVKPG